MAWLRIDDRFAWHPKLAELSRSDRWTWLEVLCYCAAYKTDGYVSSKIAEVVVRANPHFLGRAGTAGLLDWEGERYRVHDWDEYNPKDPTKAERQARWRRHKRDGGVDGSVDADVDDEVDEGVDGLAGAPPRARPVPSPSPSSKEETSSSRDPDDDFDERTKEIGWTDSQRTTARANPERAVAWIERAVAAKPANVAAYAWSGFQSGGFPSEGRGPRVNGRVTGYRLVRGSHGTTYVNDPAGTDVPQYR